MRVTLPGRRWGAGFWVRHTLARTHARSYTNSLRLALKIILDVLEYACQPFIVCMPDQMNRLRYVLCTLFLVTLMQHGADAHTFAVVIIVFIVVNFTLSISLKVYVW
jgi:hypothetical protein